MRSTIPVTAALIATLATTVSADDDVQWNGISHVGWQDRRPICPVDGQAFDVRLAAYHFDLSAVNVIVDDGSVASIPASYLEARGAYAIWSATIPATAASSLSYYFEVIDGTDVDYYSVTGMSDAPPVDGGFVLDFSTLSHAPVGATPLPEGGTVFRVWAPTRTSVHVRGEFNGWSTADLLPKVGEHFIGRVAAAVAGHAYKYFFNGSVWNSDARARALDPSDNLNSIIVDPFGYAWVTNDFVTPALDDLIIYQLHVGTFAGRNDPMGATPFPSRYVDVAARAGHLGELGVTAVMLNPITEFPGDLSAGYNPITAWAPEWKYGSPDDFKAMVDALHAEGIAVLLDVVWNHFSFDDNYLWFYDGSQIYFDTPQVDTPWGAQADFDADEVRDYYAHSAHLWLDEYRVDGFRMDATAYMTIPPQEAAGWSLMQRLNDEVDNRWIDKIVIAEQLPDDPWITRPTSLGGAGFDSQYFDAFTDRLREELLDAAFGDPEMWKIRDIINGGGTYLDGSSVTTYLELHDEAWPTSGGGRIVKAIDPTFPHDDEYAKGRTKLAQGLVLFAPGVPAMLQGAEWLEDTDFGTDTGNRIDWSKKTTYADVFRFFQDAIALRRSESAFRASAAWQVFHLNESGNVLAFRRFDGEGAFVVVVNVSNTDFASYRVGVPSPGDWAERLNSEAATYGGDGPENPGTFASDAIPVDGFSQSVSIGLPSHGIVVLGEPASLHAPDTATPDLGGGPVRIASVRPRPASRLVAVAIELEAAGPLRMSLHDATGREVALLADGRRPAGSHTFTWDLTTRGEPVVPGVYWVRAASGANVVSDRIVVAGR